MKKITYLLGAGASYHSLPLINTMLERMRAFSLFLSDKNDDGVIKNVFADTFIQELNKLIDEVDEKHTSVDAYAKWLYDKGNEAEMELLHLKALLSSYLIFEQLNKTGINFLSNGYVGGTIPAIRAAFPAEFQQALKNPIDKRYRNFVSHYKFNDGLKNYVNVLSWNYDIQLEATFNDLKKYKIETIQDILQVHPSIHNNNIDPTRSCILKLNGTAGLFEENNNVYNWFDFDNHELVNNLDYLIEILEKNYNRSFRSPLFYFSWENDSAVKKTRTLAKEIIEQTTILVIIGYSFPILNKEIDGEIFNRIPKLDKVYYQMPEDDIEEQMDRLIAIMPTMENRVKHIKNLSTFYIPNEYYA